MAAFGNFDVQAGDKFKLMITGMTGEYIGKVIDWDERRNAPLIKVEGIDMQLKRDDYILVEKIVD